MNSTTKASFLLNFRSNTRLRVSCCTSQHNLQGVVFSKEGSALGKEMPPKKRDPHRDS
jgi:hypothetical protein